MYLFCRLILIVTVLLGYFCLLALVLQSGGLIFIGLAVIVVVAISNQRYGSLTAFGTARWADTNDLRAAGMLSANRGLILGRVMEERTDLVRRAHRDLFDLTFPSNKACERFLASLRLSQKAKPYPDLVRLPQAIHTAVFAPTGVGKGVSCVIPVPAHHR